MAADEQAVGPPAAEEEPDFGGDEEADHKDLAPKRQLPDYGDLVDDVAPANIRPKEELGATKSSAPPRPEAIHIRGVQRLTRTHLAELFEVKQLPKFRWVEWIADDEVVCVWEDEKVASVVLQACEAGFEDTAGDVESPGPGLWRAQRCMLEFRCATQDDQPDEDFKRKHRGGKQVREYRFWEAAKDISHNLLEEQEHSLKRPLPPSGEDAIAAAYFDDDVSRRKRLRRGPLPEEEEDIDLLNRMAELDKAILAKQELDDDGKPILPEAYAVSLVKREPEEEQQRSAAGRGWDSWQHDGRWRGGWKSWNNSWGDDRGGNSWKRRRRPSDEDGDRGRRAGGRDAPRANATSEAWKDFRLAVDGDELERRERRAKRFKT